MSILSTKNEAFRITFEGELGIAILGPKEWTDEEFFEFSDIMAKNPFGTTKATMSIMAGGSPNARQRKYGSDRANETPSAKEMRIAVLLDSPIQKTIMTAFTWATGNKNLRAWPTREAREALEWLSGSATFDKEKALALVKEVMRLQGYNPH